MDEAKYKIFRNHLPIPDSETVWYGKGAKESTIYSDTVIAHNDVPPFKEWLPYVVALVDLDEGSRRVTTSSAACRRT